MSIVAFIFQVGRAAAGSLAAIGLSTGLALSLDDKDQSVSTFIALYGGAAAFALLCALLWFVIERRKRNEQHEAAVRPSPGVSLGRVGYRGRQGSTGKFRGTTFGEGLDTDIDNEGDVDVEDSDVR